MTVKKKPTKNEPTFDLASLSYQLTYGTDLTKVDGVGLSLLLNLIAEVGLDLSKFPTAKHFVSWLCLCPNKKITGNKVISSRSRKKILLATKKIQRYLISFAELLSREDEK